MPRDTNPHIRYDEEYGHVCTCTEKVVVDAEGDAHRTYEPTVHVVREVEPTESGSWWYACDRCGAGAWSGC